MKLFNPFKAHLVELRSNYYAIRKLTAGGWAFLDTNDKYWWHSEDAISHFKFHSLYVAMVRLQEYNKSVPKVPFSKRITG